MAPTGSPSGDLPRQIIESFSDQNVERLRARLGLPEQDGYLDAHEAAAYISCSRSAIYQKVRSGTLKTHRQGRSLRFKRADLDAAFGADR